MDVRLDSRGDDGPEPLEGYARYAIYYAPRAQEPLAQFGIGWFGRDMAGGDQPLGAFSVPADLIEEATRTPRRYGLHGTLKAPFVLADGLGAAELDRELARYAASRPAAQFRGWRLSQAHGFTALRPCCAAPGVDALAAGVAAHFARFAAPPSASALKKRRGGGLSLRQEAYLAAYGYPYLFEEFAFHVTLAGPATEEQTAELTAALQEPLAETLAERPVRLRDLCLFGDPGEGAPFRLLRRHPLAPPRAAPGPAAGAAELRESAASDM